MYAVEFKIASEGRADRLVPLLAQAILQARSAVQGLGSDVAPLAVVVAPEVRRRTLAQLRAFVHTHAPDVAFGVIDSRGLRHFEGDGLEPLNAHPAVRATTLPAMDAKVDLFSDLNQWLLKVMLARHLNDAKLLNAQVGEYRNATELAAAAGVSVMTSFRFLRQLAAERFLHESAPSIRLVRLHELLQRWQASAGRTLVEISARWIVPGQQRIRIRRALAGYGGKACLGLFAAADALDFGFVRGALTHVYLADLSTADLSKMGLARTQPGQTSDVVLRAPAARESLFRGAVSVDGLPVCDILQVWLDVASSAARGREQAQLIYRRVLKPMIERARHED